MAGNETFEDRFDHAPDAKYVEEQELDLGPDEEFADASPKQAQPAKPSERVKIKGGCGCFGKAFKLSLSVGLLYSCYVYLTDPEQFAVWREKANTVLTAVNVKAPARPAPVEKRPTEDKTVNPEHPAPVPVRVVLRGAGSLPDFLTAARQKPSLNDRLNEIERLRFDTLSAYRPLLENMIADWTGQTDPQKIEETTGLPYRVFFNQTSAALLAQTVLKQAGLTPDGTDGFIVQPPVQAMATLYPFLKEAAASQASVRERLKTLEPVSSFLIYICRDDSECMASWDLLIEMLDMKKYAPVLENAPEKIYSSGNRT